MPVDNEIYNRLSETWWDENEALGLLRTVLGPVRFGYFRRVLIEERKREPRRIKGTRSWMRRRFTEPRSLLASDVR